MKPPSRALALSVASLVLAAFAARAAPAEEPAPAAAPADAPTATNPERDAAGEEIVVTATRRAQRIRDVPAAVTLVDREEIARSPAKTADELLRVDPSYGLFRRSSSVAADPSSQGVKLRNVGGTAASRALVLVDLFAAWHATRRLDVFLAVENLLDETFHVGRAGLDTVGQPRFVHGGVRIKGGG